MFLGEPEQAGLGRACEGMAMAIDHSEYGVLRRDDETTANTVDPRGSSLRTQFRIIRSCVSSLVSEGVLAFLLCRNIDIYGVDKNVKFLRHL